MAIFVEAGRRWAAAWTAAALAALAAGCFHDTTDALRIQRSVRVRLADGELCHVVGPGEALSGIARLYGVDAQAIADRNALRGAAVFTGDLLAIPRSAPKGRSPAAVSAVRPPAREVVTSAARAREAAFAWPVRGALIRRYGRATDVGPARGIDVAARAGTTVRAAKSGQVRYVSEAFRGMGKVVIVDHGGYESSLYGHLASIEVSAGDRVKQGQHIGAVGRTGRASSDRLHFRVYRRGRPVDPLPLLR